MPIDANIKKIAIKGFDTKGLYLKDKDELFKKQEIGKAELKKLDNQPITIIVKFYFKSKIVRRTWHFNNLTGLQAVKKAIVKRIELKEELEQTGVIKKRKFKSLNEIFEDYINYKKTTASTKYVKVISTTYNKWIKDKIGSMAIDKIHTKDIQDVVTAVLAAGKKPRTAQSIKQLMSPLLNYAIDINLITTNAAKKVAIPSFDNTVDFQLSDEKRAKLYEEIQNYYYPKYKGIMLFIYFGRRLNEALTLQWHNINFEQKIYIIEDRYNKIRRRQEYPLLEPLESFLKSFNETSTGYIFRGKTTEHVTADAFRKHWKNVTKAAGIEKMRIHDTRHLLG
ncbi:MAG: tyrosine-type recombinase/integrase, partial [Campylobacterota bacterium]